MKVVYNIGRFIRNLYVVILFLPLWIGSVMYRTPGAVAPQWLQDHWSLFRILVFLQAALMLWFFVELLVKEYTEGKRVRTLAISCFVLAGTLFLICLGAILKSNGIAWGEGLFFGGTIVSPLFILWISMAYAQTRTNHKKQPESTSMESK